MSARQYRQLNSETRGRIWTDISQRMRRWTTIHTKMLSTSSVREMTIKTTRYHIISTSVAKIKKATIIVQQLLKKLKLPYDQARLLQGKYLWDSKAYVHTKSFHINIPHSRQGWRQPRCPSSWQRDKIYNSQTIKYYLSIKRNKVAIHITAWRNLESILASTSQLLVVLSKFI